MSYDKDHKTVYLPQGKDAYESLALSTANIYGPIETVISEDRIVHLCERKRMPLKESDETILQYPAIAKIKIPLNIKQPLLVLVPSKGDYVYDALVLDRDVTKLPKGSYKLVNFSSKEIRGRVGKTQFKAAPWKTTSFDPSKKNAERRLQTIFQFKDGDSWRNFGVTKWNTKKDVRKLLFSYKVPGTDQMKVRSIPIKDPIKIPAN